MANEIYHSNDVQLRQQIKAHLDEADADIAALVSDDAYGSGWNGVTDVAPSQNAVYDKLEAVDDRLDLLEGYTPGGMKYDGSTGYYSNTSVAVTGNVWTFVCAFKLPAFTGDRFGRLIRVIGTDPQSRCSAAISSSDYTTVAARNRITLFAANTAGTTIWDQVIDTDVCDNEWHVLFAAFNATTGATTIRLDGQAVTLITNTAPTAGTLETGAMNMGFGADHAGNDKLPAIIGFAGYRDAYLTNWDDFMTAGGVPLDIDDSGWTEWGAQPLAWHPQGQFDHNLGSAGDFTKNGSVTLYTNGHETAWTVPDEELGTRVAAIEADYTTEAEVDARVVAVAGDSLNGITVTGVINDDAVYTYDFGADVFSGNIIFTRNSTVNYGIYAIRAAASSAFCQSIVSAGITASTGIKTGTTGADGVLTIATHTDNRLYIENRLGASLSFTLTINAVY